MKTRSSVFFIALLTLHLGAAQHARGQWIVFDPASHVEAVLEVASTVNNVQQSIRQVRNTIKKGRRLYGDVTYFGENAIGILTGEMPWRDIVALIESLDNEELDRLLTDLKGVTSGDLVLYGTGIASGTFETGFNQLYIPIHEDQLFDKPVTDPANRAAVRLNEELQKIRQLMAGAVEAEEALIDLGVEIENLRAEITGAESPQAIAEANARLNAYSLEEGMKTQKMLVDILYAELDLRASRERYLAEDIRRWDAMHQAIKH